MSARSLTRLRELPAPVVPLLVRDVRPDLGAAADRGLAVRTQPLGRIALVHEGRRLDGRHAARTLRLLRHLPNLPMPASRRASRHRSNA